MAVPLKAQKAYQRVSPSMKHDIFQNTRYSEAKWWEDVIWYTLSLIVRYGINNGLIILIFRMLLDVQGLAQMDGFLQLEVQIPLSSFLR